MSNKSNYYNVSREQAFIEQFRIVNDEKFPNWTFNKLDETYRIAGEIFEQLTPEAVNELFSSVNSNDLDNIFNTVLEETYKTLYSNGNKAIEMSSFGYLDKLTESIEETYRCENLGYFITSVMPDFEMAPHHFDWVDIAQKFDKTCIMAARDHGKCVGLNTKIRMYDGSIKLAKDLVVGDELIGPDNSVRIVQSINFGRGKMYEVNQYRGDSYTVNHRHTLSLLKKNFHYNSKGNTSGYELSIEDIDIEDYLKLSEYKRKTQYYGFKVLQEFKHKNLDIDPYFLGIWLGDGNSNNQKISGIDKEVHKYLLQYAISMNMGISKKIDKEDKISGITIKRLNGTDRNNKLFDLLKNEGLLNNKHIPKKYKYCSSKQRLELLAGLIDSDGNLHDGCYYICQKSKQLAEDIKDLADSLGFSVKYYESNTILEWMNREDKNYKTYSIVISGDLYKIPCKIKRKQVENKVKQNHKPLPEISGYKITSKSPLKIKEIGIDDYVSFTLDGDKRFVMGDGTVTHNSFFWSNAYPAWELYRFKPKNNSAKEQSNKRGFLFSFSLSQAIDLLAILKENIQDNDILNDRLYNKDAWSKTDITCKNRTRLTVKGFGSAVRGAHPGWVVVDDGLKDNVIYSQEQRQKSIDYFHAVIMNMVVPGGRTRVVGTPFHTQDLYGDLKTKSNWHVFEYPAIYPDGRILWANRWSFKDLMDKKASQGNLIFSRELLCRPITSDATIFPIEILNTAFFRMENYTLVRNRESFPIKFNKVVTGCDFAISSSVGADYSVFLTWGIDDKDNMWLLNAYRAKGASYAQQLAVMKNIYANFHPDLMLLEQNQMQQIFVQEAERQGLPVMGHTTTGRKNDLRSGLPSLAIMFERGKFKIPTGNQESKDFADMLVLEFTSVAYTDKGLESTDGHDDIAMSTWIGVEAARQITIDVFNFNFV